MTVVMTGAGGFLGWHLRAHLRAVHQTEVVACGRSLGTGISESIAAAPQDEPLTVYHLAGVNRAESDADVEKGNVELANWVAEGVRRRGAPVRVVYANSIQALQDNAYGRGKSRAAELLQDAVASVGGTLANVLLPNLFGEHGKPHYNSFVATFSHLLAAGGTPAVTADKVVPLLHAQQAAEVLVQAGDNNTDAQMSPSGTTRAVSQVLAELESIKGLYNAGELPDLSDRFTSDLFNTYRSYTFPAQVPLIPQVHADARGRLWETVRMHGGTGQGFVSTTVPGATRGDHYHLRKFERFAVISGEAEIGLRRLFSDEVFRFRLSGDQPGFVDMPTMWVHNIRNVGPGELVTMFWADQLLDRDNPDQYPEFVSHQEQYA